MPFNELALPYTLVGLRRKNWNGRVSSMPAIWSLWGCVIRTASMQRTFSRSICCLKSGVASTIIVVLGDCTMMLLRNRLSRRSAEAQTSQGQAIMGTPLLVPVPKNVIVRGGIVTAQTYTKMIYLKQVACTATTVCQLKQADRLHRFRLTIQEE